MGGFFEMGVKSARSIGDEIAFSLRRMSTSTDRDEFSRFGDHLA
jgi:hypothetical protein